MTLLRYPRSMESIENISTLKSDPSFEKPGSSKISKHHNLAVQHQVYTSYN